MEFFYDKLKKEIDFPKFVEDRILYVKDGLCKKQLVFEYNGVYYEVSNFEVNLFDINNYDKFFSKTNVVECDIVEKVETLSYEWKKKEDLDKVNKELESMVSEINNELQEMQVHELGNIIFTFGNKNKGKTVANIFENDKSFVDWVRDNPPRYKNINKYVYDKEYCRLALLMYAESIKFLENRGR